MKQRQPLTEESLATSYRDTKQGLGNSLGGNKQTSAGELVGAPWKGDPRPLTLEEEIRIDYELAMEEEIRLNELRDLARTHPEVLYGPEKL